jgi:hypothetical protein
LIVPTKLIFVYFGMESARAARAGPAIYIGEERVKKKAQEEAQSVVVGLPDLTGKRCAPIPDENANTGHELQAIYLSCDKIWRRESAPSV